MKHKIIRRLALFMLFFVGVGAVFGSLCMLIAPEASGMNGLLPGLRKLPFGDVLFADLTFAAISLFVINGVMQLATAVLLLQRRPNAKKCVVGCGVLLMAWITIQFFIYELNAISVSYFCFGLIEFVCGLCLLKWRQD